MKRNWNFRRHHDRRMQEHAYQVIRYCWHIGEHYGSTEDARNMARRLRDNLAVCSCYACRNPRRSDWLSNSEKRTIQERKSRNFKYD